MGATKIVITGGPGTGKSTVINELIKKGYSCLEEISRTVTLEAKKEGIDQLFLKKPLLFSERLLEGRKQQFIEAKDSKESFVFVDRGVHDVLGYLNYIGTKYPQEFIDVCAECKYDYTFVLKPWKSIYTSDNERYENFGQAQEIHENLVKTYQSFNYKLIDVPFGKVEQRVNFILNTLNM